MRKKIRVAVEGQTTDKRAISRADIEQMARTYDSKVYGARIWMEHFRGLYPDSAFKAYGDVLALSTEEIADGALKGKLALFAEIEATPDMVALAKAKQKVYTSVEIQPDFPGTGESYLVGLGITDSPASLGTEYITFSASAKINPLDAKKLKPENMISTADGVFEYSEDALVEPSLFNKVLGWLKPKDSKTQAQFADIEKAFEEVTKYCGDVEKRVAAAESKVTKLESELAAERQAFAEFRTQVEKTPSANHNHRPTSTGGNSSILTDC